MRAGACVCCYLSAQHWTSCDRGTTQCLVLCTHAVLPPCNEQARSPELFTGQNILFGSWEYLLVMFLGGILSFSCFFQGHAACF